MIIKIRKENFDNITLTSWY